MSINNTVCIYSIVLIALYWQPVFNGKYHKRKTRHAYAGAGSDSTYCLIVETTLTSDNYNGFDSTQTILRME